MAMNVIRITHSDSSTKKLLLDIRRRLCDKCEDKVVCAYFGLEGDVDIEITGETAVGLCDHCLYAPPPPGMKRGDAIPIIDYFCWTFICEPEYLTVALSVHQQLAEEALREKTLVTIKNTVTKKLWFVSLASPLDALFMQEPEGAVRLRDLPYLLYYEGNRLHKIPLEHVFIYYSFSKPAKK